MENNGICHFGNNQFYSSDCIIITWNDIIEFFRIAVRITDLRKNGQAKAEKKAGRIAAEGLCRVAVKDDKTAAVVEVNSETDFVAKNADFQAYVEAVAALLDLLCDNLFLMFLVFLGYICCRDIFRSQCRNLHRKLLRRTAASLLMFMAAAESALSWKQRLM